MRYKESIDWTQFSRDDPELAVCKLCGNTYRTPNGATTSLNYHMARCVAPEEKNQGSNDQELFIDHVVYWIAR